MVAEAGGSAMKVAVALRLELHDRLPEAGDDEEPGQTNC